MTYISTLGFDYVLRMVLACLCGVCIGWERKNRAKEAGIRTHCIVACGAALMMIISKYGFTDSVIGENGVRGADGARIAAQVVSGIGFLGAGMIFVHKNTITGLTTAAGVWTTAGIGMALGAGMYFVGFSATIIILIVQIVLHRNSKLTQTPKMMMFSLYSDGEPYFQKRLYKELADMDIHVYSADVSNNSETGKFHYVLTIELPNEIDEETLVSKYSGSRIRPCN